MPRPREFDPDTVLQRALTVFWRKGYEATSLQDLVAAMGIQRASLYATFGDKRALYLRALARYQDDVLVDLQRELTAAASPLGAIRDLLRTMVEHAAGPSGRRGCFCVNANVELAPADREVAVLLRRHSRRFEALLAQALRQARARGELPAATDPRRLASFVFGVLVALNVLGKQRAGRARLRALADTAFAALGGT